MACGSVHGSGRIGTVGVCARRWAPSAALIAAPGAERRAERPGRHTGRRAEPRVPSAKAERRRRTSAARCAPVTWADTKLIDMGTGHCWERDGLPAREQRGSQEGLPGFERQPKKRTAPKILLLDPELELKAEKDNAEVRIVDPDQQQSLVGVEWAITCEKPHLLEERQVNGDG